MPGETVRGQRKDADSITKFGDGSATVVVSQGGRVGLDGGTKIGSKGTPVVPWGYDLQGPVNGDFGFVYRFPPDGYDLRNGGQPVNLANCEGK